MEMKPGYKMTEVGVIPEEWDAVDLRAVCSMKSGEGITSASIDDFSEYPCFGGNGLRGYTSRFTHDGTFALIGRQGALCGNVVRAQGKFFASEHAVVVAARLGTDIAFLTFVLSRMHLNRYSESSAQPGLSVSKVLKLALAVPPTDAEQRAIAEVLGDVDVLLDALDRLIAKKRDLKQAAMQQLLTGQTRLPGFSGAWEVKRLPSLATIARGQVDPRVAPYSSMYLIGPEHVEGGTGKLLARRTALEQGAISGKYFFKKGDVVYGKINPYLRKAFLADFDGLCSADMYPLRPVEGVPPGFLLAVILGREFSTYSESVSVRSGMPKINRGEMDGFSTKVPKAVAEQTAIAGVLSDIDAELAALEARRDKTRDLKQAMMQELLTGKTRLVKPEAALA